MKNLIPLLALVAFALCVTSCRNDDKNSKETQLLTTELQRCRSDLEKLKQEFSAYKADNNQRIAKLETSLIEAFEAKKKQSRVDFKMSIEKICLLLERIEKEQLQTPNTLSMAEKERDRLRSFLAEKMTEVQEICLQLKHAGFSDASYLSLVVSGYEADYNLFLNQLFVALLRSVNGEAGTEENIEEAFSTRKKTLDQIQKIRDLSSKY
jgi:alanyl-tRNA synthetase